MSEDRQLDGTGLKRLHRGWRRQSSGRVAVILDALGTPVNVGALVRSAAAFGVEQLWCAGASATPASPGAAKSALGTERYVPWSVTATAVDAIARAHAGGYRVVALELTGRSVPLHTLTPVPAVCLVLGHEDHGVSRAALEAADEIAYLPLVGRVGSLNVAAAAAIALYELRRQEWTAT